MLALRENEKIIKIVRQHRSVIAGTITWSVFLAGLATFTFFKFNINIFGYSWEVVVGVILIAAITILYKIYIWRKTTLTITNLRVVLNDRQGAFSRTVTELLYRDIHDISFKQTGLAALLNRYGKLIIKTPSGNEITFDRVPSPAKVIESINKVRLNIPIQAQEPNLGVEPRALTGNSVEPENIATEDKKDEF